MSRGGRWKSETPAAPSRRRGRWASGNRTVQTAEGAETPLPVESKAEELNAFDWAVNQLAGGEPDDGPGVFEVDMSAETKEDKMARALLDVVFWDGIMQYYQRMEKAGASTAVAWAAARDWRVSTVFDRLLDVMADVMERAACLDDAPVLQETARRYASKLAGMARVFAKYDSGEWKPQRQPAAIAEFAGKPELEGQPLTALDRIWLNKHFQKELQKRKGETRANSPRQRFAEFVVTNVIGYAEANAIMNYQTLILYGVEWKRPQTEEDFQAVRDILRRVSCEYLDVLAAYMDDEPGQKGAAAKVRALKRSVDRHRYWNESQLDEAFRSHFGLAKPRKKASAKKAAKVLKAKRKRA